MTPPTDRFFAAVRRQPHATSAGPCELPILYWDSSLVGFLYRVDADRARPLVDPDFEPWVLFGKAIAMFCFFEYRQSTIGYYGEVGLGLLVKRKGTTPSLVRALRDMREETDCGLNVVNLPVTTEGACAAGKELWGYPKYVTTMDMAFRPDGVRFALGKELVLTMGPSRGLATKGIPFVLYSVDGRARVLRTVIDVDHTQRWGGAGSVRLELTGEGPTATTVRALGLDAMKPLLAFRTDGLRSILPAGVDMGPSVLSANDARPAPARHDGARP
jgi:hypothetical protein